MVAVNGLAIGDLSASSSWHLRPRGKPISANYKVRLLGAVRAFLRDAQEWGWCTRRLDPHRVFATPRSVKAQIGPQPRLIADDVWAKLLWAGINLDASDLPSSGWYPLTLIRALVVTWLFAGLRSDELVRLRVGCIRWQRADGGPAAANAPRITRAPTHGTDRATLTHAWPAVPTRVIVLLAKARTPDEAAFLALGPGGQQSPITAAAAGTARIRTKMIAAVVLASFHSALAVDRARGVAAELGRFADEDLGQLLRYQSVAHPGAVRRANETKDVDAEPFARPNLAIKVVFEFARLEHRQHATADAAVPAMSVVGLPLSGLSIPLTRCDPLTRQLFTHTREDAACAGVLWHRLG